MRKRRKRWAIWKIALATVGCALLSGVLFWTSAFLDKALEEQGADPLTQAPVMTLSSFVMMVGMATGILSVLGVVWLIVRIQDARTPVWKKPGKKKRY